MRMSEVTMELGSGEKIPVIDFTGLGTADLRIRKVTATSMREAFEDFGFIYLNNHSVPQTIVDELFARSITFFDLPQANKAEAGGHPGAQLDGFGPDKHAVSKEQFSTSCGNNVQS